MSKINMIWQKSDKSHIIILLLFVITYICFISVWEDIFDKLLVVPLFSRFEPSDLSSIVFLLTIIILTIIRIKSFKERNKKNYSILPYIVIFLLWAYYRFLSDRYVLIPIKYCSFIYFYDIVGFYSLYKITGLLIPKKESNFDFKGGFYIDQSIKSKKEDILGRNIFVKDLVDKLLRTDTSNESFTIGITAHWGDGKTSFMTLMHNYIMENYSDCLTLEFNPWRYSDNVDLTSVFFSELSKLFSPLNHSLSNDILSYSKTISDLDNSQTKLVKAVLPYFTRTLSIDKQSDKIKESLKALKKQIVVFIDDIDRLTKSELAEVMKLIRNSSNFPYLYFIVSYDKEYMQKALAEVFPSCTNYYDDKIFQKEFTIPSIQRKQLTNIILSYVKDILSKDDYELLESHIVARNLTKNIDISPIKNIRDVKRLMNNYIPLYQNLKNEIDVVDLFNIEMLKLKYLNVYQILDQNRESILFRQQKAYVLYTKELHENNKKYDNSRCFDLLAYLKDEKESLGLTNLDLEILSGILKSLFHDLGIADIKQINHTNYTTRYFNLNILETDISFKDFNYLMQKPIEDIKEVFLQWMTNKAASLTSHLSIYNATNKEDLKKQISLMFYWGSISNGWYNDTNEIDSKIDGIKKLNDVWQYNEEDLAFIENTLLENGANHFIESYLSNLDFNPASWSYPLSKDKINDIRIAIFKDGLVKYASDSSQLKRCFYGTSDTKWISQGNNTYTKEIVHQQEKIKLMKEFIENNIDMTLSLFISYYIPNNDHRYSLSDLPLILWNDWDEFERFIFSIPNPSNVLKEFQSFLSQFTNSNHEKYIVFDFKHITLKD